MTFPKLTGRRLTILIVVILGVGYLTLAVSIWNGWASQRAWQISRYVPVPVGYVSWSPTWAKDYLAQSKAFRAYEAYRVKAQLPSSETQSNSGLTSINKIVRDRTLDILADQRQIKISQADLNQAYAVQLEQGPAASVEQSIRELYDWTPEEFKTYVIRIDLLRDRLMEAYSFDETKNAAIKAQAETVHDLIEPDGSNFSDIARQYSQDAYAPTGGELDFVQRGELTKELEDAAFTLKINQVSDVIHSKYGFHILQVTEKRGEGETEAVKLKSIFIPTPSVDDAIKKYLLEHRVTILAWQYRWDQKNATVVSK